jgi:hypothetical protein
MLSRVAPDRLDVVFAGVAAAVTAFLGAAAISVVLLAL